MNLLFCFGFFNIQYAKIMRSSSNANFKVLFRQKTKNEILDLVCTCACAHFIIRSLEKKWNGLYVLSKISFTIKFLTTSRTQPTFLLSWQVERSAYIEEETEISTRTPVKSWKTEFLLFLKASISNLINCFLFQIFRICWHSFSIEIWFSFPWKVFWKNVHFENFQRFEGVCLTEEQPVPQDENKTKDFKLNSQQPSPHHNPDS